MGTEVVLLAGRDGDSVRRFADFTTWPILSVQTWGEDPRGNWTLTLNLHDPELNRNDGPSSPSSPAHQGQGQSLSGLVYKWSLLLYGTERPAQATDPTHAQRAQLAARAPADSGSASAPARTLLLDSLNHRRLPKHPFLYPSVKAGRRTEAAGALLAAALLGALLRA